MIKTLEIKNFKSIKHLKLDCKRVNVFIGKPNTGKSNILESVGIFSLPFVNENLKDIIRFENMLCPKLEDWILEAAREAGVNVNVYDLPDEAKRLHSMINTNLKKLESLLDTLKDKSKMLKTLENVLKSK